MCAEPVRLGHGLGRTLDKVLFVMRRSRLERAQEYAAKAPAKHRHWYLRSNVAFDDTNDHNPMILDECPRCHGRGARGAHDECDGPSIQLVGCVTCNGTGTTGELVKYFDNDRPEVEVPVRNGSVTCPCRGWSFLVTDQSVWTGLRHVRCGQRIRPVGDA